MCGRRGRLWHGRRMWRWGRVWWRLRRGRLLLGEVVLVLYGVDCRERDAEGAWASDHGGLSLVHGGQDVRWGGVDGRYLLAYLGFGRPRYRDVVAPPGRWTVDVVDTWGMTVDRLPGEFEGRFRVDLPGRQFMALRLVRADA